MALLLDIISWTCILLGSFFCLSSAIGFFISDNVYVRQHIAGLIDTGGALFLLIGFALQAGDIWSFLKTIFMLIVVMALSPVITHIFVQACIDAHNVLPHPIQEKKKKQAKEDV